MAATFETHLIDIVQRTHNVKSFRLAAEGGALFRAGQFMEVTLKVEGRDQSKYLSFSSAPTEKDHIEFTKKLSASAFSEALRRLKIGDPVRIKMSLGAFVLDETATKHAFLAGGIGITPIRSIWKDALDRHLPVDMVLFYGNHTPEDIVFRDDFETIEKTGKGFKVVLSLDDASACPPDWKGRSGFINAEMIRAEAPDFAERIFYVCGPPGMVKAMVGLLQTQLQIPAARIKQENFIGY